MALRWKEERWLRCTRIPICHRIKPPSNMWTRTLVASRSRPFRRLTWYEVKRSAEMENLFVVGMLFSAIFRRPLISRRCTEKSRKRQLKLRKSGRKERKRRNLAERIRGHHEISGTKIGRVADGMIVPLKLQRKRRAGGKSYLLSSKAMRKRKWLSRKKLREDAQKAEIATTVQEEALVGRTVVMKGTVLLNRPMTTVVGVETVRVERIGLGGGDVVDAVVATTPSKAETKMRT